MVKIEFIHEDITNIWVALRSLWDTMNTPTMWVVLSIILIILNSSNLSPHSRGSSKVKKANFLKFIILLFDPE
jgi:hypothetical protein